MEQAARLVTYSQHKAGRWERIEAGVIVEQPVSLTVNGEVWMSFMCTPTDLEALALGFLYNENLLQSMDEVASVRVCPTQDNVDVWLNRAVENPKSWRRTSGCTGGVTAADPAETNAKVPVSFTLAPDRISDLVADLFDSQQIYREVGGVHTSVISDGQQVLLSAEDIGRHNTLDKLAGYSLLRGICTAQRILLTTGRVSSEMMQKAARMAVPVVISRTSPSSLSIELAERWGITLVGYARRDRFSVYSRPERISSDLLHVPQEINAPIQKGV